MSNVTATEHSQRQQLPNAAKHFTGASRHLPTASTFVDSDAAFAGGATAFAGSNAVVNNAVAHDQNNVPVVSGQTGNEQVQGITNFAVNSNQNLNVISASSNTATTIPAPVTVGTGTTISAPAPNLSGAYILPADNYQRTTAHVEPSKKKRKTAGGTKQHQLPMFLTKTYHMIEKCDPEIATWSENGDNFVVKNVEKFASSVLPQYFKHSNFSSFARQLNFYGFRKLKAEPILTADYDARTASYVRFFHEHFQQNKPELLVRIKRATKSDVQSKDDVELMRSEIQTLNEVIAGMQNEFDRRLTDMYIDLSGRLKEVCGVVNQQRYQQQSNVHGTGLAVVGQAHSQPQNIQNTQVRQTIPMNGGAGTEKMQTLTQACQTLKSPAMPPTMPANGEMVGGFSLK